MMLLNMFAAAIEDAAGAHGTLLGTVISMFAAGIAALTTAVVFIYKRQGRSEERTQKMLRDAAELCEAEKARMMTFSLELIRYITELTKITCSYPQCPVRGIMPAAPRPKPEDMGMRSSQS